MNHISSIIAFYLSREAEIVLNYIWNYNILYKLITHIEYKYVKCLFTLLLNSVSLRKKLTIDFEYQEKMWKYCKYTGFYVEMAAYIFTYYTT